MHDQEYDNGGPAEEVHQTSTLETIKQGRQFRELHRLPDEKPGHHLNDAEGDDAGIEQPLHCVVDRQVIVLEVEMQCVVDVGDELAQPYRIQHAAETARNDSIDEIDQAIEREDPHAEEVPLQGPLLLAADGDPIGKVQAPEQNLVVVDLPAAADHDDHGNGIGPMH